MVGDSRRAGGGRDGDDRSMVIKASADSISPIVHLRKESG
jgi:hypothetical protein